MGKSDSIIFPWYAERLSSLKGKRIAFLAQEGHNPLSSFLAPTTSQFFDLTHGWDLNQAGDWDLAGFDAVVCTRGAYFSGDPEDFIRRCLLAVVPGGKVFIDWGLGDHWRHKDYMVGWSRGEDRVSVTYGGRVHYLMSTYWLTEFESHPEVQKFSLWIKDKGYDGSLTDTVRAEVPRIASHPLPTSFDAVALWRESPQLYVMTEFSRD